MNESEKLKLCIDAALAGGNAISNSPVGEESEIKKESPVGFHAIVSKADKESQSAILNLLAKRDPEALFITEENVQEPHLKEKLIKPENMEVMKSSRVYVVDPLCGSSGFEEGFPMWGISVGCVEKLVHTAGAIYAPKILLDRLPVVGGETYANEIFQGLKDGTIFYASSEGAFLETRGKKCELTPSGTRKLKEVCGQVGVDIYIEKKYPKHFRYVGWLGGKVRTLSSINSSAVSLGCVAAGALDFLLQPTQFPWEFVAGKPIVERAGGTMLFYEMTKKRITRVNKLEPRHYNPEHRATAFIAAGNEYLAETIFSELENRYNQKI